ncbi:MAG: hypothetical protein FE78DRAFT_217639 [Acidomyces sp. 'richmondensis']|nr:MAG: hypothetical protein FE78DRAFT_217639 [Acidomyces sp. 'richmondensis']
MGREEVAAGGGGVRNGGRAERRGRDGWAGGKGRGMSRGGQYFLGYICCPRCHHPLSDVPGRRSGGKGCYVAATVACEVHQRPKPVFGASGNTPTANDWACLSTADRIPWGTTSRKDTSLRYMHAALLRASEEVVTTSASSGHHPPSMLDTARCENRPVST